MEIQKIYIYPVKSLRPYEVQSAIISRYGLTHDRNFMLVKVHRDEGSRRVERLENMHISHFPKMALFLPSIEPVDGKAENIIVKYVAPKTVLDEKPTSSLSQDTIRIPLQVRLESLESVEIKMHESPTTAYNMGSQYNDWFKECFGYEVMLLYLGANSREVLGSFSPSESNPPPPAASPSLFSSLYSMMTLPTPKPAQEKHRIGFQDCAQFLVVTAESLSDVSCRLPPDQPMDVTKFRPNILLSGSSGPWVEDFWGELTIFSAHGPNHSNKDPQESGQDKVTIALTANCIRCQSINIDYVTGAPGTDESGTVLKKLQKDRRVDKGAKWSPCFGRYGFAASSDVGKRLVVGDRVVVTRVNEERTFFDWPSL